MADLQRIAEAVGQRLDWGVAALQRLIAVDSVAPREGECQAALAESLRTEGLKLRLVPLPEERLRQAEGFVETGLPLADRPNLVAEWGRGEAGAPSLVLNSHVDVVAWEGGSVAWSAHPLSGELREGRILGRGAVDAKGQLIAAAMALLSLRDAGLEPAGRVTLQSVVDEEPGGNGTLAACLDTEMPDAAIVLEPTGLDVAYGHRGIIGLRVTAEAEPGHAAVAGRAPRGAIARAAEAIRALELALDGWSSPQDAAYGSPSLNVGRIAGGEDIFSVPRRCEFEVGLRYAPGTAEALMAAVRAALAPFRVSWDGSPAELRAEVFSHYDAAETPADHPLTQGLLHAASLARLGGDAPTAEGGPSLTTFPGGCDARHFVNRLAVPTVIFGPGSLAAAHAVDEALPVEDLLAAARTLAWFIADWCGTAA